MDVLVSIFESIRDIPYRIPLKWDEEDNCCSGKHERLLKLLTDQGYKVELDWTEYTESIRAFPSYSTAP